MLRCPTKSPSLPPMPIAGGSIIASVDLRRMKSRERTALSDLPAGAERMRVAIVNIGHIVSGNWRDPFLNGDTIISEAGRIVSVGTASASEVSSADVVIDADGVTAIPGLIDSHVHTTFGDYTPRQKTVGFLESYLHGGVTTCISASEVHVPGRPRAPVGVKALAVAAFKSFEKFRPGG